MRSAKLAGFRRIGRAIGADATPKYLKIQYFLSGMGSAKH